MPESLPIRFCPFVISCFPGLEPRNLNNSVQIPLSRRARALCQGSSGRPIKNSPIMACQRRRADDDKGRVSKVSASLRRCAQEGNLQRGLDPGVVLTRTKTAARDHTRAR